jgi:hypothetical protein
MANRKSSNNTGASYPSTITDLKADERNPRTITPEAADGLQKSIAEFGDLSSIVFSTVTGRLVAGHQRVDQLKQKYGDQLRVHPPQGGTDRGYIRCPNGDVFAVRFVDWDEDRARMANVTANNQFIAGEFSDDIGDLLKELAAQDQELFGNLRLDDLAADLKIDLGSLDGDAGGSGDEDAVPEPPVNPVTRKGDVWLLGAYWSCEDCGKTYSYEEGKALGGECPCG